MLKTVSEPANINALPRDMVVSKRADYITAVVKLSDKLITLVEPESILFAEENRQLQKS